MQHSLTHDPTRRRSGFTLVELLVVISIILILMGLLTYAVFPTVGVARELEVQTELSSLEKALGDFKMQFHDLPPSSFTLREEDTGWTNTERAVLRRFWPNYDFGNANVFDANGNGNSTDVITLNGAECLVFFLGGILKDSGTVSDRIPNGFSKNPTAPFQPGGTRVGPFHEFDNSRLVLQDTNGDSSLDDEFKMLVDPLSDGGNPIMYVNSDEYNSPVTALSGSGMTKAYSQNVAEDVFWKGQTFQLISAGADGIYGQGGVFDSNSAGTALSGAREGERDNITNFHQGRLAP
ncbi:hypothetical protein Pla110_35600 [Polystyrenella longa]|uniref:Type II secretion system protein G n=1 Tax=Polystyrenella longa TaxID=2528007 RepID=A0A518CRH1_9PLAN|nr:type II secretion system protein [Polystyrenella longa]QDU81810.1 hypothetical protein Pla110_35600 [Polystyrenella longa]